MDKQQEHFRTRIFSAIAFIALAILEGLIQKPFNDLNLNDILLILLKALPIIAIVVLAGWWIYKEVIWRLEQYAENKLAQIKSELNQCKEDIFVLQLVSKIRVQNIRMESIKASYHFFSENTNSNLGLNDRWGNYDYKERKETIDQIMKQKTLNKVQAEEIADRFFHTYIASIF